VETDVAQRRRVKPRIVVEVSFVEWTRDDLLRHPEFVGVRADKKPRDVKREACPKQLMSRSRWTNQQSSDRRWFRRAGGESSACWGFPVAYSPPQTQGLAPHHPASPTRSHRLRTVPLRSPESWEQL
jgi:ATP dependent DNA ligase C terminal region